jgi:hypothetical protein
MSARKVVIVADREMEAKILENTYANHALHPRL